MTFSCPFNCCGRDDHCSDTLPLHIRGFRSECQPNEHFNTFCELCQTGMGYSSKSLNKHEDGRKHRRLYRAKKNLQIKNTKEWSQTQNLLKEEFSRGIIDSSKEIKKHRTSCDIFLRLVGTGILVFKPWVVEVKGALFDWEHDFIGESELRKVCDLVAFKEIMCIVQLGFITTRLSYNGILLLNKKVEISRLLATDGHVIMSRIHEFIGIDIPWLQRCFNSLKKRKWS